VDKIGKAPIGQSIGPFIGILVCWNILAVFVAAEADELAIGLHCTCMRAARRHGHHGPKAWRHLALPKAVAAEADV
jgi:hypothetical protein